MRNCEHPAYQRPERKLRRFCGALWSFEALLREDGFDYDEGMQWWYREFKVLEALEDAVLRDPARNEEFRREEARVEGEVFKRMDLLLMLIVAHAPDHPSLPPYRLYMALWHQCYGEPIRPLSEADLKPLEEPEEIIIAPVIYGVPFERLDAARLQLGRMKLPHKDIPALVMFVCGLTHATACQARHGKTPEHAFEDGLREAARQSLEEAVDFANESGTRDQARSVETEVMTENFGRLFMAISYASRCHTPAVFEWLSRDSFTRDLTSLLFAMGVRALTDPYGGDLISGWAANPGRALSLLPEECLALIASFGEPG